MGEFENLGGTRQGNSASGSIFRDTTCIIFKHLEDKKLGVTVVSPMSKNAIQLIVIMFADDNDFFTSGEENETKKQQIMDQHTTSHEATGGKIQQDEIMFLLEMASLQW